MPGTAITDYGLPVAFYFQVEFSSMKNPLSFKEVSGLSLEMELEAIKEGGLNTYEHKLPKQVKHGNLVLKRALRAIKFKDAAWIRDALERDFTTRITLQDIIVKLLNEKGDPISVWTCRKAFPVKWEVDPLSSEKNEVLIESIEFSYSTITRTRL